MTQPDAEPMTNIATDVIEGYKTGLAGGPMGFVSAAFDCGWLTGAHERAALSEQPSVATVTECEACLTPDVCRLRGTCDHYAAERLRVAAHPAPVERVPLSDEQVLACIRSAQVGPVPMGMTRERGPYDVTEPTYFAQRFARAVIAEYERLSGISATPRQPLSEAQIAAVLRKASERAGFVTLEAGEPSAFMVGVVRDVEAAHGITPAQGKETQG